MTALHLDRFTLARPTRLRDGEPQWLSAWRYQSQMMEIRGVFEDRDTLNLLIASTGSYGYLTFPATAAILKRDESSPRVLQGKWEAPDRKEWIITAAPRSVEKGDPASLYFVCELARFRA
jgi:hypothetical protein